MSPVAPLALTARTALPIPSVAEPVLLIGAPTRPAWALYRHASGFGLEATAGLFFSRHPIVIVTTPDQLHTCSALAPLAARTPLVVRELNAEHILAALRRRPDLAGLIGVLTLDERTAPMVAEVAAALRLPGPGSPADAPHGLDLTWWGTGSHSTPHSTLVTVTAICASASGHSRLVAIARTLHRPQDGRAATVLVDPTDPLLADQRLTRAITEALAVLQVQTGLTHLRLQLEQDSARVVQITNGVGTPMVARLIELAHGVELSELALALATGAGPEHLGQLITARPGRATGSVAAAALTYGLAAPAGARLQDLATHPGLDRLIWQHPLDHLRPLSWPADQPSGYGIVTAPDPTLCMARLSPLADALEAA